jgi:integrase
MNRSKARRPRESGALRHLPSGRWQAKIRNAEGKLVPASCGTFATKVAAEMWLRDYNDGVATGVQIDTTLDDYWPIWLASRIASDKGLKPRTESHYRSLYATHLAPAFGDVTLRRITPTRVQEFYNGLDASKPTLRAHVYGLLRVVLGDAYSADLITSQPCRIKGASKAKRAHVVVKITPAQIAALALALPERLAMMVYLASFCGLRFGEVTALQRGDVDCATGRIIVERGVTRTTAHGFVVGTPKSEAGLRTVTMPEAMRPLMQAHLDEHVQDGTDALLFPARYDASKHLAPGTWCKSWYPARVHVGLPTLHFHDLRHFGITLVHKSGATLREAMVWGGHSTLDAAMIYTHADEDSADEIAANIAAAFVTHKATSKRLRAA